MNFNSILRALAIVRRSKFERSLKMRITTVLLIVATMQVGASGLAQKVSLKFKNDKLLTVFREIEKQTNYSFVYGKEQLAQTKNVNLSVQNENLETVLDLVFKDQPIAYIISGNHIVLKGKKKYQDFVSENLNVISPVNIIKGKIEDEKGNPVSGANVSVKGSNVSVQSDANGDFFIEANDNDVLIISFTGYTTREIKVGSQKEIKINLKQAQNQLDDIVVIGYQKVHKKEANAAIASISSKELESIPVISVSSLLSSLTSGVQVPSQSGAPGSRNNVVIRGNTNVSGASDGTGLSSPLYVIDGIQTSLEDLVGFNSSNTDFLASLNPNDIESIDILKDASAAAIYGSRGANGVIIITTKKGGALSSPEFNFTLNSGFTPIPPLVPMLVGAAERRAKMDMIYKHWQSKYQQGPEMPMILSDSLNPAFNNNMDYQKLFYRNGFSNKYNLSMRGGSEFSNYRISLGYDNVEGVVQNTGFKRYTLAANTNAKVGKRFENQFRVGLTLTENKTGQGNPYIYGSSSNFDFNSTVPTDPSNLNSSLFYVSEAKIASLRGNLSSKLNTDKANQATFSNYSKLDIINGLTLNTQFNFVYNVQKKNYYEPSILRDNGDGFASYSIYTRKNFSSDVYVNYYKKIKEHNISAVFGFKTDYNNYEDMGVAASGFGPDAVKVVNDRYRMDQIGGYSSIESNSLMSIFGRLGYNYNKKYSIDFAFSRDGSSRFGEDVRFANFPSVSVGWIFSDESFIKNNISHILNYGKFRASYGVNGKQFSENALRYSAYSMGFGGNVYSSNNMNVGSYGGVTGVVPNYNTIGKPNLSWENTEQWNLGADLAFFKNRLNVTFDAYNKKTDNLLFTIPYPAYSGYSSGKDNLVGVMNYGWESMVKWRVLPIGNWDLELSGGISQNKNYVTKLPNGNRDFYGGGGSGTYGYVVGLPLNLPVMYHTAYILDYVSQLPVNPFTGQVLKSKWDSTLDPGYPIFTDYNGDYNIDEAGDLKLNTKFKPTPDFIGSFNINLKYKGWYFQAYSYFSFGSDIINTSTSRYMNKYTRGGSDWAEKGLADLSGYTFWEKPGDGAAGVDYPSLYPITTGMTSYYNFRENQDLWVVSGDYWKVSNVSIGYTLDKGPIVEQLHIARARLYSSILNPYQWQRSNKVTDASQVNEQGRTLGNGYPQSKTITLGLDVKF